MTHSLEIIVEVVVKVVVVCSHVFKCILLLFIDGFFAHKADTLRLAENPALSHDLNSLFLTVIAVIPSIVSCLLCIVLKVYSLVVLEARVSLFHCILLEAHFHLCFVGFELQIAELVQVFALVIKLVEVDVRSHFFLLF